MIETNLGGTFNYCHAVTQPMMMMRRGSIVNLSSTAAEFAARGQVNYAASKGGINGLTRSLAKELAPRNVRVNAIAPGMIETDMSQVVRGIAGEQIQKMIPLKRIGSPRGGRRGGGFPGQRRRGLSDRSGAPRRRRLELGRILEEEKGDSPHLCERHRASAFAQMGTVPFFPLDFQHRGRLENISCQRRKKSSRRFGLLWSTPLESMRRT